MRHAGRDVRADREPARRQQRPRAHDGLRLRGRLDAAHGRRAVHPHGRHLAVAARQHGPAGRRHHGAARAREHSRRDRHPDALRSAAGLSADALDAARRADVRRVSQERDQTRLVVEHAEVHDLAAQSVLRRCGHGGERFLLRLSAADFGRPLGAADADLDEGRQRQRLLRHRHEPGRVGPERRTRARRDRTLGVDGRHRLLRNGNGVVLAPRRRRSGERSAPKRSSCRAATVLEKDGTMVNTNRHAAMARQSRRAGRRKQVRSVSDLSARHAAEDALRGFDRVERPADPGPHVGVSARRRARAQQGRTVGRKVLQEINGYKVEPGKPGYECEQVERVRRSQRRRLDGLRRVDLSPACIPTKRRIARAIARKTTGRRSTGALRGRRIGACSTIARRPIPTASRGASARSTCTGMRRRRSGPVPTCRIFRSAKPRYAAQTRRARHRRACRQRSVHHAARRAHPALRGRYAQRRSVAGALRADGFGRAQPRLRPAEQSGAARMGSRRQPLQRHRRIRTIRTCSRRTG